MTPIDSVRGVIVAVLLGLGTFTVLLSCVAVLRLPGLPAQLHGLAPAGTLGAPLVCLGLAIDLGVGRSAGKALLVALVLLVTGPIATTVTARAAISSDDPPPEFTDVSTSGSPADSDARTDSGNDTGTPS